MNTKDQIKKKVQELSRAINGMRNDLCFAISEERYEDAAVIRDAAAVRQQELIKLLLMSNSKK